MARLFELDSKAIAQNITVQVKLKRMPQWQWRVQLAMWLIMLADRVMWGNVKLEVEDGS